MRSAGVKYGSRIQASTSPYGIPSTVNACSVVAYCAFRDQPSSFHSKYSSPLGGRISATCSGTSSLLRTCSRCFTETPAPLMIGNTDNGIRTPENSVCQISDIIGAGCSIGGGTLSSGTDKRLSGGDVLGLMDLCASRSAMLHLTGVRAYPPIKPSMKLINETALSGDVNSKEAQASIFPYTVATVATDCTNFIHPLLQGDPVIVRGTVVHVGASSIGVYVEVMRIQFPTREQLVISYAFFTMVAMNKSLAKVKVVPALNISNPRHLYLHKVYNKAMKDGKLLRIKQEEFEEEFSIEALDRNEDGDVEGEMSCPQKRRSKKLLTLFSGIETPINRVKRYKSTFASSRIEASRIFFPGHLNFNSTIFGGEILRWMEMHAVYCGRLFTGRPHISSIGMHNVTFKKPIYLNDWVTLDAHVVYVHNSTMEVDVRLSIEHIVVDEGEDQKNGLKKLTYTTEQTNTASFVLILLDEIGQRRIIESGLELLNEESPSEDTIKDNLKWLKRYTEAKLRNKMRQNEILQEGYIAEREKYQLIYV